MMAGQRLAEPAFPLLELAKYYEHVRREYGQASQLVERLLLTDELRGGSEARPALEHRLARLRRRLVQTAGRAAGDSIERPAD
jgi:hypothetical protein